MSNPLKDKEKVGALYAELQNGKPAGWPLPIMEDGLSAKRIKEQSYNDQASAVEVDPGWEVTLYKHSKERGKSLTVSGPATVNLHNEGMADMVSSVSVRKHSTTTEAAAGAARGAAQTAKSWWKDASKETKRNALLIGGAILFLWITS